MFPDKNAAGIRGRPFLHDVTEQCVCNGCRHGEDYFVTGFVLQDMDRCVLPVDIIDGEADDVCFPEAHVKPKLYHGFFPEGDRCIPFPEDLPECFLLFFRKSYDEGFPRSTDAGKCQEQKRIIRHVVLPQELKEFPDPGIVGIFAFGSIVPVAEIELFNVDRCKAFK